MYFRKASTRGVIVTYDMIQTPPTRVAIVTSAKRTTALIAATASTMPPHSHETSCKGAGNDVPTRRQDMGTSNSNSRGGDEWK